VPGNPTQFESYAERQRRELAERKAKQEASRDETLEQCVIAYHAHRVSGGQSRWADFRIDWYKLHGYELKVTDGR
jgi:hypothetical protein